MAIFSAPSFLIHTLDYLVIPKRFERLTHALEAIKIQL